MRETRTGQQVAQIHERYMMMINRRIFKFMICFGHPLSEIKKQHISGYLLTSLKPEEE
jgi:hypothetical protein